MISDVAMNLNKGSFGEHFLGGDSCPPITCEVVPYSQPCSHFLVTKDVGSSRVEPSRRRESIFGLENSGRLR